MYIIKWKKTLSKQWIKGISSYPSKKTAQKQMKMFESIFPFNDYEIEKFDF
jgi:hypothetical protein